MLIFKKNVAIGLLVFATSSCIGVDYQDDAIIDPQIKLETDQIGIKIGEQRQLAPSYVDEFGQEKAVAFTYSSSNPDLVEVSAAGLVRGVSSGTAFVQVSFEEKAMITVQVNVVSNSDEVALVNISSSRRVLFPGQKTQMEIRIQNLEGTELDGKPIQWFSENDVIASVDQDGLVTGEKFGKADIHAKVMGVKSNPITITVGVQQVSGTFVPAGGYRAKGMAFLNQENGLILRLSPDFETSFALGTFVYLSNSTNGSEIRASGLELAEIRTNGAHTFDITAKFPDVQITDYKYVIIFCKPAGVTFGFAEMKN